MKRGGGQYKLFETEARLENGLRYRPDFITAEEEELLIVFIESLPLLSGPAYGKRHTKNLGWWWDYERACFLPGPPLPPFLGRFARRIEKWLDLPRGRIVEALINKYPEGASVGWHRDNEGFEHVVGISLSGWAKMRFRPLASKSKSEGRRGMIYHTPEPAQNVQKMVGIELEPRSVYLMAGPVRWDWQHSVAPARTLRYSITFRTLP